MLIQKFCVGLTMLLVLGNPFLFGQVHWSENKAMVRVPEGQVIRLKGNLKQEISRDWQGKGVLILDGNRQQTISLGGASALVVDNPHGLRLQQNLQIYQQIEFRQGKIFTGPHFLQINRPSEQAIRVLDTDAFVVGKLKRKILSGVWLFPVGSSDINYSAYLNLPNQQNPIWLEMAFVPGPSQVQPGLSVAGQPVEKLWEAGRWRLEAASGQILSYDLELQVQPNQLMAHPERMVLLNRIQEQWLVDGYPYLDQIGLDTLGNIRLKRSNLRFLGDIAIGYVEDPLSNVEEWLNGSSCQILFNGQEGQHRKLKLELDQYQEVQIETFDIQGKKLFTQQLSLGPGIHEIPLSFQPAPPNSYMLLIRHAKGMSIEKLW